MPQPIIASQRQSRENGILDFFALQGSRSQALDGLHLDRLLRRPRSKAYMQALRRLDTGGHVCNQRQVDEIMDAVRAEFPEVDMVGILLGVVAVCYLGKPYEVHSLDITGRIIEHYKMGHAMPDGLERARGLALHGGYEFVEVYDGCCRAVAADGSVSVVPC